VQIVSFSGIDGAGKSTQIDEFERWLRGLGLRTQVLTFWDDVVILARWREVASLQAFKGDRGVGSPEKPLHRRDKNVNSSPLTLARLLLYLGDALSLRTRAARENKSDVDVVIFDRYIYDELANLPLARSWTRAFVRIIFKIVPRPSLALVIDAHPEAAHARKPEYPLEFVRRNRQAYLALAAIAGGIIVVAPESIAAMRSAIRREMLRTLPPQSLPTQENPSANISPLELIEP
jgi:thymidylate kinase